MAFGLVALIFIFGGVDWLNRLVFREPAGLDVVTQWLAALVLCLVLGWTTVDITSLPLKLMVAGIALLETATLGWVVHTVGGAWSPVMALVGGGLATLFGLIYCQTEEGQRKQITEGLFADRVSARTLREFVDSDLPLPLAGAHREVSTVVCELVNAEKLSQQLPPEVYLALLNQFSDVVAEKVKEAGGIVDLIEGHRVAGHFGAFLPAKQHAVAACLTALEVNGALAAFAAECIQRWEVIPDYRVGVASGEAIAGVAPNTLRFAVVGETLDFATRLARATVFYGSKTLAAPETLRLAAKRIEVRPLELIRRPGEGLAPQDVFEVYELLGTTDQITQEELEQRNLFWRGVVLYREKLWDEAAKCFETVIKNAGSEDAPARFYLRRVQEAKEGSPVVISDLLRV